MVDKKSRYMRMIMFIPAIIIFYYGIQWLRFGIDLPFFDDWRAFDYREAGLFSISILFKSNNDTIYAVSKFIDAFFTAYSGYNIVLYQFLTLIFCLGGIFLFLYLILRKFHDLKILCISIISSIFILQKDSYWGAQAIAYQQALPILFILMAIYISIVDRIFFWLRITLIAFLGVLAGFSYISGAFAVLTVGLVSLVTACFSRSAMASRYWQAATGFLLAALVTLPFQLRVILVIQKGGIHDPKGAWTWPWEGDFWWFIFGMIGRSIGVYGYGHKLWLYLPAVIAFLLLILVFSYSALKTVLFERKDTYKIDKAFVYLCVAACIGIYIAIVAASRAKLGMTGQEFAYYKFLHGGSRFHYFWVTVLIPFLMANLMEKYVSFGGVLTNAKTYMFSLIILIYAFFVGTFNYESHFRSLQERARLSLKCIQENIITSQPIVCPTTYPWKLNKAIQYARSVDASFIKYLFFPPVGVDAHLTSVNGARKSGSGESEIVVDAGNDPQLYFTLSPKGGKKISECQELKVTGLVTSDQPDIFQVFYLKKDERQYTERASSAVRYQAGQDVPVDIRVASKNGFQSVIRVDPGTGDGRYILRNISFACY